MSHRDDDANRSKEAPDEVAIRSKPTSVQTKTSRNVPITVTLVPLSQSELRSHRRREIQSATYAVFEP